MRVLSSQKVAKVVLHDDDQLQTCLLLNDVKNAGENAVGNLLDSCRLADGLFTQVPLSRTEFEAAVQPLLRRIWAPMERAGSATHLEWADRCQFRLVIPNSRR